MLKEVFTRISEKGIQLQVTVRFKTHLIDEGYNPIYAVRPLRRAVSDYQNIHYQKNSFLKKLEKVTQLL